MKKQKEGYESHFLPSHLVRVEGSSPDHETGISFVPENVLIFATLQRCKLHLKRDVICTFAM